MNALYTPSHIANFFIDKAKEDGINMSILKLLKLIYISYGWYSVVAPKEKDRMFDEAIEAWKHGPVVPSLYHEFKHSRNITMNSILPSTDDTLVTSDKIVHYIPRVDFSLDKYARVVLNKVWQGYKHYSALALVELTHQANSPWSKTYQKNQNKQIRHEDIKEHYLELLEKLA